MPNSLREIRRRIKAVKNTKQITKAMEMVSASKMRRAQSATLKTRAYAEKAMEILVELAGHTGQISHPLLEQREIKHTTVILVTSDRGLCGGFNLNLINTLHQFLKDLPKESLNLITLGKKGRDTLLRFGYKISADFSGAVRTEFREILPIVQIAFQDYMAKKTDRVIVAYTHFINTMKQKPLLKTLLPLSQENLMEIIQEILGTDQKTAPKREFEYLIEPDPTAVLTSLLPRLSEIQIFQAILESEASEQSSRMVAMKNATDAATDLISDLTLTANGMRQSSITAEIAEIVTAGEAMKE